MSNEREPQSSSSIRGRRRGDRRGETERKERGRDGRRNLTYFSLAYLYAEDNRVNQPEASELA